MINKKGLWFLTLFSLILVLSIYYITMPSELLLKTSTDIIEEDQTTINTEQSNILVSLRLEDDEKISSELEELQQVLSNVESTTDEKNKAIEKIKEINNNRGEEEKLENKIKENFKLKSFIKINGNNINITIKSSKHDVTKANNIIRCIQENYEQKKYITVKFQ